MDGCVATIGALHNAWVTGILQDDKAVYKALGLGLCSPTPCLALQVS